MEQVGTNGTVETQTRNTKGRVWCFTLNNYTDQDITEIKHVLEDCVDYVVGKEVGTNGTPHLQGVVKWTNAKYFHSIRKTFNGRAHWEPCKNWNASVLYCKKEGDYFAKNMTESLEEQYNNHMAQIYEGVQWHPWQKNIIDLIRGIPLPRKVHWYFEENGNTGKSFLCKYLDWKFDTIICNGKADNVFHCIKTYIEEEKKYPKVIILDIPRCMKDFISYQAIEKIKDGLLYSGKYEGGKVRLLPVHLIIFANEEPKYTELSADRWDVHHI